MSIDTIQLKESVCKQLFPRSLIERPNVIIPVTEKIAAPTQITEPISTNSVIKAIPSIGENKGQIIFLVSNNSRKGLSEEEMNLTKNLMKACNLTFEDIALIHFLPTLPITYETLFDEFNAKKIVTFGSDASQLGLPFNIPSFQIQSFRTEQYLFAPALKDFFDNIDLKKKLWTCLRSLFLDK